MGNSPGSGYLPNSTIDLEITGNGGAGGYVEVSTNGNGQISNLPNSSLTIVYAGSGYASSTPAPTFNSPVTMTYDTANQALELAFQFNYQTNVSLPLDLEGTAINIPGLSQLVSTSGSSSSLNLAANVTANFTLGFDGANGFALHRWGEHFCQRRREHRCRQDAEPAWLRERFSVTDH